jgi:hypothetical protein
MTFLLLVTLSSMLVAAIMSVIAWRIAAEERRRSDARVAALAAEIHAPAAPAVAAQRAPVRVDAAVGRVAAPRLAAVAQPRSAQRWDEDLPLRPSEHAPAAAQLFAASQHATSGRRLGFVAVAVAAVGGLVLIAALLRDGGSTLAPPASARQTATGDNQTAPAVQPVPLELVALGQERDGDRLIVRGVIRRQLSGPALDELTAVVFVFNADGGFVTSARSTLDAGMLRSAGESPFVVTVPDAASASRYRVSFRSGDRIVPHVDRREPVKRS